MAILDGLRTVSWSNYSHPTGVVNRLTDPTFPLPAIAEESKRHTLKIFVNNPPYRDRRPTVNRSGKVMKIPTSKVIKVVYQIYPVISARGGHGPPNL